MADQRPMSTVATAFDTQLERVLGAYGDTALRPVDDLAIASIAITIERRRAARRPYAWLAAAALLGALLLLGLAAVGGGSRGLQFLDWLGLGPRPSVVETPAPGVLPAQLIGRWASAPRDIPGIGSTSDKQLLITSTTVCLADRARTSACAAVESRAATIGPDQLELVTVTAVTGCDQQSIGRYRVQPSPGGRRLTVTADRDDCAARQAALVGTWWHSECTNVSDDCLGLLEAGTYPSRHLSVRGPEDVTAATFGAVTYTVPSGWANSGDWTQLLSLTPAADYANEGPAGAAVGAYYELDVFPHPLAAIQDLGCSGTVDTSVAETPEAFAAWIASQASFDVLDGGALTVAGYPAVALDVQLAAGYTAVCSGESVPSADYLLLRDDSGHGFTPRLRGPEVARLILVDIGGGDLLAVLIDSSDPARFDDLVAASMPIVTSLVIR